MSMNFGRLGRFEADLSNPLLFKRCANCPPEPPPCPACKSDEVCSLFGGGCDTCPSTRCEPLNGGSGGSSSSSPAGPIAGGVIGGIAVICILTFLFWRFCIRKRRQQYDDQVWRASQYEKSSEDEDLQSRRDRASMHSVRSIASTVLTRASNVIQIAYIPGVTNRSVESTPDLIPPVPPVPALSAFGSTSNSPRVPQDEHFFLPSDLRNSTYSDYTVDRTSYARTSMTPSVARGSVPSTAYRGSAIVNTVPAQTAIRGKANPVAVKLGGKNSPTERSRSGTPASSSAKAAMKANVKNSPIVARSGVPKAVTVTKSNPNLAAAAKAAKTASPVPSEKSVAKSEPVQSKKDRKASTAGSRYDGRSSTFDDASSSDEESPANRSLMGHDKLPRFSRLDRTDKQESLDSPASAPDLRLAPSPLYSSSQDRARKQSHKRSGSLNQIIEEATRNARRDPKHGGLGSVGNISENPERRRGTPEGPFSDANAAGTP